jgi:hypothetical protein
MNQSTMERTAPDRFWAKVDKRGPDECWEWQAALTRGGYGTFVVTKSPKRMARAHRFAWELTHGEEPKGLHVCHQCDNPLCVNPAHLWLGTNQDNMRDCADKGRAAHQGQTHCKRGHEFTPENTYGGVSANGRPKRHCRACVLMSQKKRYDRLRALGVPSKDI